MQQDFHPAMAAQQQQPDYSAAMPYGQPPQQYDAMAYQQAQQYGQHAAPYQPAGYGGDPAYGMQQGPPMQVSLRCIAGSLRAHLLAAVATSMAKIISVGQVSVGRRPPMVISDHPLPSCACPSAWRCAMFFGGPCAR